MIWCGNRKFKHFYYQWRKSKLSGSYDAHDEHSGDISANDTDNDASPTHTITAIRTGSTEGSGTSGSLGSALDGTYGQLTLNAMVLILTLQTKLQRMPLMQGILLMIILITQSVMGQTLILV